MHHANSNDLYVDLGQIFDVAVMYHSLRIHKNSHGAIAQSEQNLTYKQNNKNSRGAVA